MPQGLLWAHVAWRTKNEVSVRRKGSGRRAAAHDLRNAEVQCLDEHLSVFASRKKEIGWFEIAMQNTFGMRVFEGPCDVLHQRLYVHRGQALTGQQFGLERHPVQQFHHEVRDAVCFPMICDSNDVARLSGKSSRYLGFESKAGRGPDSLFWSTCPKRLRQELDGDALPQ